MRIAHVNDIAFVGSTLVREMRRLGQDADLIEPARIGAGLPYPWKAVTVPFRLAGVLGAGLLVRRGNYDVVHVHYARLGILGPLGGQPFVLHCHGTDVRGLAQGSAWARVVEPALRRAAAVYYSTPDLAVDVRSVRPDATFLPNPIDIRRFGPDASAAPPARDILVGVRLDPMKGLDAIIETLRRLLADRPATTVTVVAHGGGLEALRAAVRGDIEVIRPMPQQALPAVFRRHRLALGQLRVGAIGNFELEALAGGLPVAAAFRYPEAYDVPPPVVLADDPGATAARIAGLLDDEGARLVLSATGAAWVIEHHAATLIATRLIEDYGRLGLVGPVGP